MPQELQVLQCCSCGTFQVHIVKKSPKWECKICGEKQSVVKVYGKGSGKECRLYVQELNRKRLESNQEPSIIDVGEDINLQNEPPKNVTRMCNDIKPNRWTEFISSTSTTDSDSNDILDYKLEPRIKKRKLEKKPAQAGINEEDDSINLATENNKDFCEISPNKPKEQKILQLNQKENSFPYQFSGSSTGNEIPHNATSSRWVECLSTPSTDNILDIEKNTEVKSEKVTQLFNDKEYNLDSIFTF